MTEGRHHRFGLASRHQPRRYGQASTPATEPDPHERTRAEEEAALVASAQSGDEAAFEELVRRHSQRLRRVLVRITRDPEAAQDALQDALLRGWQNIDRFQVRSSFFTWLTRIAINEAYRTIRRDDSARVLPLDDAIGERIPSLSESGR